jgi:hypothetical protein
MVPPKTLMHSEPHDQPSRVVPQQRRYPQPKDLLRVEPAGWSRPQSRMAALEALLSPGSRPPSFRFSPVSDGLGYVENG